MNGRKKQNTWKKEINVKQNMKRENNRSKYMKQERKKQEDGR